MSDPIFEDAVAGRAWIVDPDPWAYVESGWASLFSETLDRVGALMARHPGAVLRGLGAREERGELRLRSSTRPPPDIEGEVRALWREAGERSKRTCQFCGRPGRPRTDGRLWWATACDGHA